MVNIRHVRSTHAVLFLAALVLTGSAWQRGAEYDEQYTLFLTAGTPRPDWPETAFPAGTIAAMQAGHAGPAAIARDLRATDVHPPLYFWAVSIWRAVFGPGLFAARLLSVLCGLISLSLIAAIARRCAIAPLTPMLLTLGSYGFVYTNAIARGFAPAQMLTLCGVALLLGRRPMLAGACLGAACCCNYLAAFVSAAVILAAEAWLAVPAAIPFLGVAAWFFAAQHAARPGQFPPFGIGPALLRSAQYQAAAVFGGLPLYVNGFARIALGAAVGLASIGLLLSVNRARPWHAGLAIRPILAAAMATPIGLLLLGVAFNNTPIELRYFSFGLPFIALLAAWSLHPIATASARCRLDAAALSTAARRTLLPLILTLQCASIAGLLSSPRTMQPFRATATEAARLAGDGIILLPRGNDGVGIVGAFGIEAPPALPILLLRPTDPIAERIAPYHRVVLALLPQDRDSTATIPVVRAALSPPNWHRVAIGSNVEIYERTHAGE